MKFRVIFFILLLFSCSTGTVKKDTANLYRATGFALIYSDKDYENRIISGKLKENELQIAHDKIKKNSIVKITNPENLKITLVVSEWHSEITNKLFEGANNLLIKNGLLQENIKRLDVPGSFELIHGCRMAQNNDQNAVIAIGCVIKGETPHFNFICNAVSTGIKDLNILYKIPVIFCVLTDNTIEQSFERSGGKYGNKGEDCAIAALKLISTIDK